jgi:hypothetical protein
VRIPPTLKEVDLVLVPIVNCRTARIVGIVRVEKCVAKVPEPRIGGLPGFKLLADAFDRSGERQQQILRQRDVGRKQSGNLVDSPHRNIAGAAVDQRDDVAGRVRASRGPRRRAGEAEFGAHFDGMNTSCPTQRVAVTRQGVPVAVIVGADHVSRKQCRTLQHRDAVDPGQEVPCFFLDNKEGSVWNLVSRYAQRNSFSNEGESVDVSWTAITRGSALFSPFHPLGHGDNASLVL